MLRSLALSLALAAPALAQPLTTDRPDFTESPTAVAPGTIQLEAGTRFGYDATTAQGNDLETASVSAPQALVRVGLRPGLELRLGAPTFSAARTEVTGPMAQTINASGWTDPSVGAKAELRPVSGWDLGVIAQATLPVGELSQGVVVPSVIVTAGREVRPGLSVGVQGEAEYVPLARLSEAQRTTLAGVLVAGYELTERIGTFGEVRVVSALSGAAARTQLHHGYTFGVTDDLQLDARVGTTVNGEDLFGGVGIAARF